MAIAMKMMSEFFGPGYYVLDVRFARLDSDGSAEYACVGQGAVPGAGPAPISTACGLTLSRGLAFRWRNRSVPARFGRTSRFRRRGSLWLRELFRIGRTSLALAAAGMAVLLVTATAFSGVESRLVALSRQGNSRAHVGRLQDENTRGATPTVSERIRREYGNGAAHWQEGPPTLDNLSVCYATAAWCEAGDRTQ